MTTVFKVRGVEVDPPTGQIRAEWENEVTIAGALTLDDVDALADMIYADWAFTVQARGRTPLRIAATGDRPVLGEWEVRGGALVARPGVTPSTVAREHRRG